MDSLAKYALQLIEEQAASYERVMKEGQSVTLGVDNLTAPLRAMAAKIRKRASEDG